MKGLIGEDNLVDSDKNNFLKKHVLFVLSSFDVGGAEIDVLKLATILVNKGYEVTIASKGGNLEKRLPPNVRILHLNVVSKNLGVFILNKLRILSYCIANQVTLLNPQSIKGILISVLAAKLLKIPLVATIHNLYDAKWLVESAFLLNRIPNITLFVSEYERQRLIKAGMRPELSRVMYSGIDLKNFAIKSESCRYEKIGIIGRLSKEKGVDFGIQAFAKIAGQYPETKLMIVGDGRERQHLLTLTRKLGVERQVLFTGQSNNVAGLLQELDFLVLPSLSESLSVVAREAMAAGKPVIASDVGGMYELIVHNENGLLVPSGNVSALSDAMEKLLNNHDLVNKMGKASKELIETKFSSFTWGNKMDIIYRKAGGERIKPDSHKRNILYVTTRFPFPTTKGDKLRAYYQIRELSKRHNVFLLSMFKHQPDEQNFAELKKYCKDIITVYLPPKEAMLQRCLSHMTWTPSMIGFFYSRKLKKLLPKVVLAKNIDTLFCQLIRGGQYAVTIKNVWKIVDFVDALSLNIKRNYDNTAFINIKQKLTFFLQANKVKRYEQMILKAFDRAVIISEQDKKFLSKQENILISPNGVEQDTTPAPVDSMEEKSIIFTGNMNYWPNENAVKCLVEEILPHLPEEVKVYIVGVNDNPGVKKYDSNRIIVTGKVPSITKYLQQIMVAVCPMRLGAGQQNKVLEAMAAGIPVVATSIANSGIDAPPDCIIITDDPVEFAIAIKEFLDDPMLRLQFRNNALNFIKRFRWDKLVQELEDQLWEKE